MNDVVKRSVAEFRQNFACGMQSIVAACEVYVSVLDMGVEAADWFRAEFEADVPDSMWRHFEAIGRKWVHPKLFFGNCKHRNKIKALPYSDQKRVLEDKVPLLLDGGDSMLVALDRSDKWVIDRVLGEGEIRSLDQQRAFMERQKQTAIKICPSALYEVRGHKVFFRAGAVLSKSQVKKLLEAL